VCPAPSSPKQGIRSFFTRRVEAKEAPSVVEGDHHDDDDTPPGVERSMSQTVTDLAASALGVTSDALACEVDFVHSILTGGALKDHLQPPYYSALENCLIKAKGKRARNPKDCLSSVAASATANAHTDTAIGTGTAADEGPVLSTAQ
jgi:hypothetical protein